MHANMDKRGAEKTLERFHNSDGTHGHELGTWGTCRNGSTKRLESPTIVWGARLPLRATSRERKKFVLLVPDFGAIKWTLFWLVLFSVPLKVRPKNGHTFRLRELKTNWAQESFSHRLGKQNSLQCEQVLHEPSRVTAQRLVVIWMTWPNL